MSHKRALYSVVQYVPDDSRAEAANCGVVLYVPSDRFLGSRVSESLERVQRCFRPGRQGLQRIRIALEALEHRMELARGEFEDEGDLAAFVAARADKVRLSPPRVAMVDDPAQELDALFFELVGDRDAAHAVARRLPSLPPHVAEVFGRLEAQHKVSRPGAVRLPKIGRLFEVPIAYDNGRRNYVRPESLGPGTRLDSRLAQLGFGGKLIYQHPIQGRQGQLVVLSADPEADEADERRFAETLRDFSVRFVPYAAADEFADEVERTVH